MLTPTTPSAATEVPAARLVDPAGTACRADGMRWSATLVLDLPEGSVVEQRWRVEGGGQELDLGAVATPVETAVRATVPIDELQRFGPRWDADLPFTFEHRIEALTPDGTSVQVLRATCSEVGADATMEVLGAGAPGDPAAPTSPTVGADPAPDPATDPTLQPVLVPRFAG